MLAVVAALEGRERLGAAVGPAEQGEQGRHRRLLLGVVRELGPASAIGIVVRVGRQGFAAGGRGGRDAGLVTARRAVATVSVARKKPARASLNRPGLRDSTSWPQSGTTNSRPSGELAREIAEACSTGHERVAVAADDQGRGVDPVELARRQQRLGRDVGGDRRQQPPPRARALARRRGGGRGRAAQAGSSRSIRSGSISRRSDATPAARAGS